MDSSHRLRISAWHFSIASIFIHYRRIWSLASPDPSTSLKSLTLCDWTHGPGSIQETSRYPRLELLPIQRCSREAVQEIIAWVEPCNLRLLEVMFHASHDTGDRDFIPEHSTNRLLSIRIGPRGGALEKVVFWVQPATCDRDGEYSG